MKTYVVYSRGILRYEGIDYVMEDGRPSFSSSLNENDNITVFVYEKLETSSSVPKYITDRQLLSERRDYVCLDTEDFEPMRAKSRTVTKF